MRTDGKQLEELVAFVEKTLLPHGFKVDTNDLIYEDGAQIAELDIVVRGKIGSTNIAWLIECRDRPGKGRAPGYWIEQLASRRNRFKFNKVTAVSTTGFAAGAAKYAQEQGIEIREVRALCAEDLTDWLKIQHLRQRNCEAKLHATQLCLTKENEMIGGRPFLGSYLPKPGMQTSFDLRKVASGCLPRRRFMRACLRKETSLKDWSQMLLEGI